MIIELPVGTFIVSETFYVPFDDVREAVIDMPGVAHADDADAIERRERAAMARPIIKKRPLVETR